MSVIEPIQLNLRDLYRLTDIKRWQIVRVTRPQSVAEHSFGVAVIALDLCARKGIKDPAVLHRVSLHALHHDMAEVLIGDIASPVKKLAPEIQKIEEDTICKATEGYHITPEEHFLVKLADLIEAVKYLHEFGSGQHADMVRANLEGKVRQTGDQEAVDAMNSILVGRQTFADSVC